MRRMVIALSARYFTTIVQWTEIINVKYVFNYYYLEITNRFLNKNWQKKLSIFYSLLSCYSRLRYLCTDYLNGGYITILNLTTICWQSSEWFIEITNWLVLVPTQQLVFLLVLKLEKENWCSIAAKYRTIILSE